MKVSSVFLACTLLMSVLWGPCAYCPQFVPERAAKPACCAHHKLGHCGMPAPKQPAGKTCPVVKLTPVIQQDDRPGAGQLIAQAAVAVPVLIVPAAPALSPEPVIGRAAPPGAPPPDLCLLNSTLLV